MKTYIKNFTFVFLALFVLNFFVALPARAEDPIPSETILIRNGDTVIYEGSIDLPASGNIDIIDHANATHSINARSVLGVLYALDAQSDAFSISDLEYYTSFSSFYLKCITPSGGSELCDNWQYVVNNTTPGSGIDTVTLSGGETIGLYFGNPHQVVFDTTSITAGGSINATAQRYNYLDNTWGALTGVTIGATQPNPDDVWSPTVVTSSLVDSNGLATLTLAEAGTYNVGIAEDFYFPTYPVTVTAPVSSGGGGSSYVPVHNILDVAKAIQFLQTTQKSDGSFGDALYTDWVAIGLAKVPNVDTTTLSAYLKTHDLADNLALSEYERRAMALEALGIDPNIGTSKNYIQEIIKSFDGTQFGDKDLYNDDIFAIIPLMHAGYTTADIEIQKAIAFIISKQNIDGGWDGTDITSAAIQALALAPDLQGVSETLAKAKTYLATEQKSDGGFGSSFSTSWALGAIKSLGESPEAWQKNNLNPNDYLFTLQANDGGVESIEKEVNNRIWATAYAIPSALGLNWGSTLNHFEKVKIVPIVAEVIQEKQEKIATPIVKKIASKKEITKPKFLGEKKIESEIETPENLLVASAGSANNSKSFSFKKAARSVWTSLSNLVTSIFGF